MLYTYCLIPSPQPSLSLPPGFVTELKLIEQASLAAVVEADLPREQLEEDDQKLVQAIIHHDAVICEIFRQTFLLPLRFGTYFREKQELLDHLNANASRYHQKLQELAGMVELTLKLTPIPFSQEPSSSTVEKGRNYLKAKKQRYQQQTEYQNQQQKELKAFPAKINLNYPHFIHGDPQDSTERFYLLINASTLPVFSEQIKQWEKELQTWQIEVSDPLPPYHFL
jgi:uncharacterized membrane protein YcgQ (UPF0703/DUF1980 family)